MSETYKVGDIVERQAISKEGRPVKTYRIGAETATGVNFTVEVAEADFTKVKVDKILKAKAALIDEVKGL